MNALPKTLVGLLTSLLLLPALVLAQVPDRVGRIAYLSGDVQFYSESERAWVPAELNTPVTSRNSLSTGSGARAEVRFGSATVTLDARTQLDITVLDDERFKAGVTRGSVNLWVPLLDGDESYEVSATPRRYALLESGRYRIDVDDTSSSVTVFGGMANAISPGSEVLVDAGKSLIAKGATYQLSAARLTPLDLWAVQRDDAFHLGQSTRHVSPNMTGHEELDANGRWGNDPDYGTVWYPSTYVSPDWAPYRDGRWAYVAPWGWTWIDAAPWGFAPFHYGRWVKIGPAWAWAPGTYVKRPGYAPALVAFVGGTPGASISIGLRPALSWYPLSPWETYRPAYKHSSHHLGSVNNLRVREAPAHALQTIDRQRISVNQFQGRTEVPHAAFVESRPLGRIVSSSSARHQPPQASVLGGEPIAPSGRARFESAERRITQEPGNWPAAREHRSSGEWNRSALPSRTPEVMPSVRQRTPEPAPASRVEIPLPPVFPGIPLPTSRRHEGWQRGSSPATAVETRQEVRQEIRTERRSEMRPEMRPETRPDPSPQQNRFGREAPGARAETPHPAPPVISAPANRVEPPAVRSEPRIEPPVRPFARAAEAPREPRREPEKERSSTPERGRSHGEGRGREPGQP